MQIEIKPIVLKGNWDIGYALDMHTVRSEYVGEDAFGHPHFNTEHTPLGEILYKFKYHKDYSQLPNIVETAKAFLESNSEFQDIEMVIPVPPTEEREYQPTYEIVTALAEAMKKPYCLDVLENVSDTAVKSLSGAKKQKLKGRIIKRKDAKRKHNLLLVDDLYSSGATLSQCVTELRKDKKISNIYVLTITKTRNKK